MDASGNWRRLAGELNKSMEWVTLTEQRHHQSPTSALLSDWGHANPTIDQFFTTLHKLGLYREMERIKPFVSRHLHRLLQDDTGIDGPTCTSDLPGPGDSANLYAGQSPPANSWQGSHREGVEMTEPLHKSKAPCQPDGNSAAVTLASSLNAIPFSKIKTATSNFCEHFQLGVGGFSKVYKGYMDGTTFAIKVIAPRDRSMDKKSLMEHHKNEIEKLTKYRHKNIINLSGYSCDGPEFCLVMEYMEKGSLEKCLGDKLEGQSKPLSWSIRHSVLKDAACGLEYLHSQKEPCIHGDIKSANILLDCNFVAKLADFGLAKQAKTTHDMTSNATGYTCVTQHGINGNEKAFGTLAYLPSDFMSNGAKFSRYTDIFSMGVVICEVLTGRKAYSKKEKPGKEFLKERVKVILRERCRGGQGQGQDLIDLADRNAEGWPGNLWSRLMDLALDCLKDKQRNRPNSKTLHERLTELCKEANKLYSASKDDKGKSDYDEKMQNKLDADSRENVMNIVSEDHEFRKKVQAVGTPSMVAHRGSEYNEKDLQMTEETAVIGDMYGPGDSKIKQCDESDESYWMNYDAKKLANDEMMTKESNLNAEADDPKYLQYDEKKLSNETMLLERVPSEQDNRQGLFNGLPVNQNRPNASHAYQVSAGEMLSVADSIPGQPKSIQELLADMPESVKMEFYYEMSKKMQEQSKKGNQGNGRENNASGVESLSAGDTRCSSMPVNGVGKVVVAEDRSLPNMACGTPDCATGQASLRGSAAGSQLEDEADEFRRKMEKISIGLSEECEEGDIDSSLLPSFIGSNMEFQ